MRFAATNHTHNNHLLDKSRRRRRENGSKLNFVSHARAVFQIIIGNQQQQQLQRATGTIIWRPWNHEDHVAGVTMNNGKWGAQLFIYTQCCCCCCCYLDCCSATSAHQLFAHPVQSASSRLLRSLADRNSFAPPAAATRLSGRAINHFGPQNSAPARANSSTSLNIQ